MTSFSHIICAAALPLGVLAAGPSLLDRFANPPETSRLQAWYHWNGDCVTKEGLVADLKAMGEMDIGTAHVFLPAMANLPVTAKPLTPEWFGLWHTAIAEAKKNNLRLGFHNCPGWSSSGGPWIRPEDSMKMVVASETDVEPGTASVRLAQPVTIQDFYRDIRTVAFPVARPPRLVKASGDFPADYPAFCSGAKPLVLPLGRKGASCSLSLEYDRPLRAGFAVFTLDDAHFYAKGTVSASADGKTWTVCKAFTYQMFNGQRTPKVLQLDTIVPQARFFRVSFAYIPVPPWVALRNRILTSFVLTDLPLVPDVDAKNAASTSIAYRAPSAAEAAEPGLAKAAIVDLSPRLAADGVVDLRELPVPPSNTIWRILRIGYTSTGKNCAPATLRGLECDKLSRRGLDAHWPHMPKRMLEAPGAKDVLSISIIDSYEVGGQNWTEDFPREFRKRRGYALEPYLPAVAGYRVGTAGETARFLYDYQRTVSDLFAENYYDYFAELCHQAGIEAASEPYGGPFDSLRCGAASDVPTGEFWIGRAAHGSPRIAASIGHLNGRSKIAAEAFTTEAKEGRWQITPSQLRRFGDRGWLEGISQLVYHSYLHQPFGDVQPGISLGRHGTQLNRNTTWWPEGVNWSRYVRRGQFLLQSGRPQAEVLFFVGESAPNAFAYPDDLVSRGANFDYCGIADLRKLTVKDGGVSMPGGLPYDVLYLGKDRHLSLATVRGLAALAAAGARLAGLKPLGTPTLSDDAAVWQREVDALWAGGRIRPAESASAALSAFGLRANVESGCRLRGLRRVIEGRDVYFVLNPSDSPFDGAVSLAARGRPECWNAKDGSAKALPVIKGTDAGRVKIRLSLPPGGSRFVVFDPAGAPTAFAEEPKTEWAEAAVLSARYCARDDKTLARDVTEIVRRLLNAGTTEISVSNSVLGGDPAPNRPKILDLVYTVDGARRQQIIPERTSVTLRFERPPAVPAPRVAIDLSTDWTADSFQGRNAPTGRVVYAKLASWSTAADERLKYFAGRAVYRRTFSVPADLLARDLVLDLGEVRELATVRLNGTNLGCLWEAPYRVPVRGRLKPGGNVLEIEVVNTWPNRLIGDARARKNGAAEPMSPKGPWPQWVLDRKPDSGTGIFTWSNFMGWTADEPLLPAGLLGPVQIVEGTE
ncbi:MAG: glycosyl hydrolase [Kiritimatiellia bacterium]